MRLERVNDYLFDLDGCIWFGRRLAHGAASLVSYLRQEGKGVFFLTNTSGAGSDKVAHKLTDLGIDAAAETVLAPLSVVSKHPVLEQGRAAYVIGTLAVREALRASGLRVTDDADTANVVIVGRDPAMTYGHLAAAARVLDRGGKLLALNLDLRVPGEDGAYEPGNGAIVAALSAATGVQPEVVGKPSEFFFRQALDAFSVRPETTAMVGDSLDADIAGGFGVGLVTVLVGDGVGLEASGAKPDLHVQDLAELHDMIAHARR